MAPAPSWTPSLERQVTATMRSPCACRGAPLEPSWTPVYIGGLLGLGAWLGLAVGFGGPSPDPNHAVSRRCIAHVTTAAARSDPSPRRALARAARGGARARHSSCRVLLRLPVCSGGVESGHHHAPLRLRITCIRLASGAASTGGAPPAWRCGCWTRGWLCALSGSRTHAHPRPHAPGPR